MKTWFCAIGAIVALSAATTYAQPQDPKVEAGQKAFVAQKCGTCHAVKGVSTGKLASALDGVGTKLKDAEIKAWLTSPAELEAKLPKKPAMPMSTFMKTHKLTDADVDGLVAYLKSLK